MVLLLATEGELTIRFRVNDKIALLSRSYHNGDSASARSSMHHAQPRSESRALFTNQSGSTQSEPQARSLLPARYLRCERRRSRGSYRLDPSLRFVDIVGVVSHR